MPKMGSHFQKVSSTRADLTRPHHQGDDNIKDTRVPDLLVNKSSIALHVQTDKSVGVIGAGRAC